MFPENTRGFDSTPFAEFTAAHITCLLHVLFPDVCLACTSIDENLESILKCLTMEHARNKQEDVDGLELILIVLLTSFAYMPT